MCTIINSHDYGKHKEKLPGTEITITYNPNCQAFTQDKVTGSKDAHAVLFESRHKDKIDLLEQFKVMLLNRVNMASFK